MSFPYSFIRLSRDPANAGFLEEMANLELESSYANSFKLLVLESIVLRVMRELETIFKMQRPKHHLEQWQSNGFGQEPIQKKNQDFSDYIFVFLSLE